MGTTKSIGGEVFILKIGIKKNMVLAFPDNSFPSTTETMGHHCKIFLKCFFKIYF